MNRHPHFQKLAIKARQEAPLSAAVVYACDLDALQLALSGEFAGYLAPTLVGPEARIRDFAGKAGLNISRLPIVDTKDDPRAAALRAIELARNGQTEALIKGGLGIEEQQVYAGRFPREDAEIDAVGRNRGAQRGSLSALGPVPLQAALRPSPGASWPPPPPDPAGSRISSAAP